MQGTEYRLFFDNKPATFDQLMRVKEIIVEQEVDMAWESHLQIPITVDDNGKWSGENEGFLSPFSRIRIEIKIGDSSFVPLIDGPIIQIDTQMSSRPGQSSMTVIVNDDSTFLNQKEKVEQFENLKDDEIARQIFQRIDTIKSTDIVSTNNPQPAVVQRGTEMQLLRSLAKRQGMHVYVLPGQSPGESIGCFKPFPTQTDGLAPLILLGQEQNIETFSVTNDAQLPTDVQASHIDIADKSIPQSNASFLDADLMGEQPLLFSILAAKTLHPYQYSLWDVDRAVKTEAVNSTFALEGTGQVLNQRYPNVLQPYRLVSIFGVNGMLSGNYLITKVVHKLTRWSYSQSFTVIRNAFSSGSANGSSLTEVIF